MENILIEDNRIRRYLISICVSLAIGCFLLPTYEPLTLVKFILLFIICFGWCHLCNKYQKRRTETRNKKLIKKVFCKFTIYCVDNHLIKEKDMMNFQQELKIYAFGKANRIIYIKSSNGLLFTVKDNYSKFVPVISKRN